ncbi:MAG: SCO family protein [Nitrosomonadales bacterium]
MGLYGDDRATIQAARTFGVNFEKHTEKNGDYTLDHSDGTFLIGMSGKPVLLSPYDQHTDLLVQDIRLLLTVRQAHRDGLMDYAG